MQPVQTITVALLGGGTDDFPVVGNGNMAVLVSIAVAFAKAIDEDAGVLIAVVDDAGHGDDVAVNAILCLDRSGVITECHQHLFKLVHCGGHRQTEEVQPLGIDEAHVANGLDGGLFCAELLDPGQCPDVALAVGAHGAVLRVLLKDLLEIRHIVVNVVFQIEDDTLICVAQQIAVGKISSKNKIRQGIGVGHIQGDLIAPLVGLDGGPVDVHIGLLFQTLEDGAVVRLGFAAHREAGHTGKGDLFGQRKFNGTGRIHSCGSRIAAAGGFAAATGRQSSGRASQSADLEEVAARDQLFHGIFSFFMFLFSCDR